MFLIPQAENDDRYFVIKKKNTQKSISLEPRMLRSWYVSLLEENEHGYTTNYALIFLYLRQTYCLIKISKLIFLPYFLIISNIRKELFF